jgi:septal ring factor EnvC (AmiA/AmiB activator)
MSPIGPAATFARVALVLLTARPSSDQLRESAQRRFGDVQQRLAAEKMLLDALREQKLGALEALDFLQERAVQSTARAERLERALNLLQERIKVAEAEREKARGELDSQVAQLEPRLVLLYRLLRHRPVELIASVEDSNSVLWRSRHVAAIVDRDLALLARVRRAVAYQRVNSSNLVALRDVLEWARELAARESHEAAIRRTSWSQWLASLEAGERKSSRLVLELEQAERHLAELVQRLSGPARPSGFEGLKGRLPYPTNGIIEVGFGRVVNPKFNTVTVQKGVDIHAAKGAVVRAVADGKVVYAAWLRGYGNLMIVDHGDRYHSLMAHLDSFGRTVGEVVQQGEELGRVGDSGSVKGPYLYFEIRKAGEALDPAVWLRELER